MKMEKKYADEKSELNGAHRPDNSFLYSLCLLVTIAMPFFCEGQVHNDSIFVSNKFLASIKARAERGDAFSLCILSRIYRRGEIVKQDYTKAFNLAKIAESKQEPLSWFLLGRCYEDGLGVRKDSAEAQKYYDKFFTEMTKKRYLLKLGEYEVALASLFYYNKKYKNVREAFNIYKSAVRKGNDLAKMGLAYAYTFCPDSSYVNIDSAINLYRSLIVEYPTNKICYNNLGAIYRNSKKDTVAALELYHKASMLGYSLASYNLANHYYERKDFSSAVDFYKRAAEQGESSHQVWLGFLYENGFMVDRDYEKAVFWYITAANQFDAIAEYRLAWMYYLGAGVEKDIDKCKNLLTSSMPNCPEAISFYEAIKDL